MAQIQAIPPANYGNDSITAGVVQQGTGNAGRDVYNASVIVQSEHQPKPPPSSTVPFRRDDDFINRESLNGIRQTCRKPASRAALIGVGGVGKSQIAIEYAHQVRDESSNTWVFWVHAGTQARFEEGYRRIAEAIRMDGWDNPKANILRFVRSWLCDESNGQWVMIVDNADDSSVFFPPPHGTQAVGVGSSGQAAEPLLDFLPQSPNGSILITSRSRDVAYRLTGSHTCIIEVKPMDEGEALALLWKKLSSDTDEHNAIELLQSLDYMPLAITQAAAFIEHRAPRMTISRYLNEVRGGDDDRACLLKKDIGDSHRDERASNSIIATWHISFEHIRKEMPTAARLLSLMSFFDGQGIPESLLHNQYQGDNDREADFEEDIHTLTSYSLVRMSADSSEFKLHQLVQFSTKKWLELYNELEGWRKKYVKLIDDNYPVGRYENWTVCQALFPHVQAAVGCRPTDAKALEVWASVLFKATWYASEIGNYDAAKEIGASALQAREALLGAEHRDTLSSLNSLGLVLWWQGKYENAEAMHRRALEGYKKVLGLEHPDTLTSMGNLASTYRNQGRWKEAEELEVQVMETSARVLGLEHPDTLTSMGNLASTYSNQGRWKEAEELDMQVVEARKRVLGEEHPDTLTSMANLASTYRNQGRWKEAEELDVQVMETSKRVLGLEHPDALTSMANLASTYSNQGRWEEAEELEVQVMETSSRVLGLEHPDTLTSMANLASTYRNQGRWKEAEELQAKELQICSRVLGPEHPDTLTSMANLASTYKNQGRRKEAEELEMQVMETSARVLGLEHPDTLTTMANLASTYRNQGRWKEAEELEVQVMETSARVLGLEHPDTLTGMNNLAFTLKSQSRNEEAISLMKKCFFLRKQILGPQHPYTTSSLATLNAWQLKNIQIGL